MTAPEAGGVAPVAVIGMSCRFPGAGDTARFWEGLLSGADHVRPAPTGRWKTSAGSAPRSGGFLDDVEGFDAEFFGVPAREARFMDPQQRLMLELSWECLEDAGIRPDTLRGSPWGVFVGACADDFRLRYLMSGELDRFGHTGTSRCMLANRVSHHFGLRGPSEVIDTGQSSSLAALHRALCALRLGECEAAVVGGVNLNLLGEITEQVALWGGLSPDGRCHTFDAQANGYVRGEGGGCVVLKSLDAAARDGDTVYAVVRGSAVTNDGGHDSPGVPSTEAQRTAVMAALRVSGARAEDVAYLELHGTGTPVGDPVEARAAGEALGSARAAGDPLPVGSVKTNIGHLESAAGLAGFIKACLILRYRQLPPSLHFTVAAPGIPLEELNLRVVTRAEPREFASDEVVGVSSFGMGGTNVHVLVGPAPDHSADEEADGPAVWCLSGRSRGAVRELAAALLEHPFPEPETTVAAVGRTLVRRTLWDHRAAVVGADWAQVREGLEKVAAGHDFAFPGNWPSTAGPDGADWVRAASEYVHVGDTAPVTAVMGAYRRSVPGLPPHRFARTRFALPAQVPAVPPAAVPEPLGSAVEDDFVLRWTRAAGPERTWLTLAMLECELAVVLGGPVSGLDPEQPFKDLGIDSMTLLELLDRTALATGLDLPETLLFDHPTINAMATCVAKEMERKHG